MRGLAFAHPLILEYQKSVVRESQTAHRTYWRAQEFEDSSFASLIFTAKNVAHYDDMTLTLPIFSI